MTHNPAFDRPPTHKADKDAVHALMKFVEAMKNQAKRQQFLSDHQVPDGIPPGLASALQAITDEAQLKLLGELHGHLDSAKLFDEYNPKLMYF